MTSGGIVFDGEDITALPVNERAKRGIFLSFQNPLEVPGVTLSAFIRSALEPTLSLIHIFQSSSGHVWQNDTAR